MPMKAMVASISTSASIMKITSTECSAGVLWKILWRAPEVWTDRETRGLLTTLHYGKRLNLSILCIGLHHGARVSLAGIWSAR